MFRWLKSFLGFGPRALPEAPKVIELPPPESEITPETVEPEPVPTVIIETPPELPAADQPKPILLPAAIRAPKVRAGLFAPAYLRPQDQRTTRFVAPDRIAGATIVQSHRNPIPSAALIEAVAEPVPQPPGEIYTNQDSDLPFPILLANYVLFAEADPMRLDAANQRFLLSVETRSLCTLLRDQVLEHWRAARRPLSPATLHDLARSISKDPQQALLLSYGVTRAFSDGSVAIPWKRVHRTKGLYSTGIEMFTVPAGGSILPQIFDGSVSTDRTDWTRYFGAALLLQSDPPAPDAHWAGPDWCRELAATFDRIRTMAQDPRWAWTNAVFAYETSRWGCVPDRVAECHRAAWRGAVWGQSLRAAPAAGWLVPALSESGKDSIWPVPAAS